MALEHVYLESLCLTAGIWVMINTSTRTILTTGTSLEQQLLPSKSLPTVCLVFFPCLLIPLSKALIICFRNSV